MYELNLFSEDKENLKEFLQKFYNKNFDIKESNFKKIFQSFWKKMLTMRKVCFEKQNFDDAQFFLVF